MEWTKASLGEKQVTTCVYFVFVIYPITDTFFKLRKVKIFLCFHSVKFLTRDWMKGLFPGDCFCHWKLCSLQTFIGWCISGSYKDCIVSHRTAFTLRFIYHTCSVSCISAFTPTAQVQRDLETSPTVFQRSTALPILMEDVMEHVENLIKIKEIIFLLYALWCAEVH